ncbi:MAG TPA: hypothetical protein VI258_06115 [Rhodanobacteraceae bacterium]
MNRQLAMAAIDEHREHDCARAAEIDERVERRANGAAGVEHVVDEHHDFVVDRLGKLRRLDHRLRRDRRQVVAIQRDVEDSERNRVPFHLLDLFGDALADRNAAAANADNDQVGRAAILLDGFDGHSANRTVHARAIEETFLYVHVLARGRRPLAFSVVGSPLSPRDLTTDNRQRTKRFLGARGYHARHTALTQTYGVPPQIC